MENQKSKVQSVRVFDEEIETFRELAKKLDVPQAELMRQWRTSYERLQLEEQTSQGENLKTLRNYTDKIINLFTVVTESTEETVRNEQELAVQSEKKYEQQLVKTDNIKKESSERIAELEKEKKRLASDLEKYQGFEEAVEGRISDKDEIIASKVSTIISLNDKVRKLEEENEQIKDFEKKELLWENQIEELEDKIKQQELEHKESLLVLREELQEKHTRKIQEIYDVESEKREKIRDGVENRLRQEHQVDIERIRREHQEEVQRIRDEQKEETERIRKEFERQIEGIQKSHANEISSLDKQQKGINKNQDK